jgi:hypothetical protein
MSDVLLEMMSCDEWESKFVPIPNTYISNNDESCAHLLYETFGDEHSHVLDTYNDPNTWRNVWTLIDGDDGTYIVSGYHFVNRIGYYITEKPADENTYYIVAVDGYASHE